MNKGKIRKSAAAVLVMVLLLTVLTGCANFEKKKAFSDYGQSLSDDAAKWQELSEASKSLSNTRDLTTMKAGLQARIIPTLEELATSAQQRNQNLTDAELKKVDDNYVKSCNNLLSAYKKILDGINHNDATMMQSGVNDTNAAMMNMQAYGISLQNYMDTYGINDNGSVSNFIKSFS